jgi:hypothetical protein
VPLKNITITVEEDVARWARRKAADENTSVSKLVGQMLAREMVKKPDSYWQAYERWKKLPPIPGLDAEPRLTREELHERR